MPTFRAPIHTLLLLACLLVLFRLPAREIDSLKQRLAAQKDDTSKVNTLLRLSSLLARQDPALATEYGVRGLALARQLKFRRGEGSAEQRLGIVNYYKGDLAVALEHLLGAAKIFKDLKHQRGVAGTETLLGIIYHTKGNLESALQHYNEALVINEQMEDKAGIATGHNNIGLVHFLRKNHAKSLESFSKALALFTLQKDRPNEAIALNNIGNAYAGLGNYGKALEFYARSLNLKNELGDNYGLVESYYSIGRMYYAQGQYSRAAENLREAAAYAEKIGERSHLAEAYNYLSRCDSATGNFTGAYTNLRSYQRIRDSLTRAENLKLMTELQARYETEKKELLIENQVKEIDKQTVQKLAFAIGFAGMLILALIVFRSYRLKRKANHAIMMQKKVIEEKNREILDSIYYARRIQRSLMPTDKYIARILNKNRKPERGARGQPK